MAFRAGADTTVTALAIELIWIVPITAQVRHLRSNAAWNRRAANTAVPTLQRNIREKYQTFSSRRSRSVTMARSSTFCRLAA